MLLEIILKPTNLQTERILDSPLKNAGEVASSLSGLPFPQIQHPGMRTMALGISEVTPPQDCSNVGKRLTHKKQLCTSPPIVNSGRITYLLVVEIQYLAQCLVGRKCLVTNERMAALLAWCSTFFFLPKE